MATYRVKVKDIKHGKTAYIVSMGSICKIVFTARPKRYYKCGFKGELRFSYRYVERYDRASGIFIPLVFDHTSFVSDYNLVKKRNNETNSIFTNLNAALRYVALTKENRRNHEARCDDLLSLSI